MKKIFAILLVLCMIFALGACSGVNDDAKNTTSSTADSDFQVSGLPDEAILGAWEYADGEEPGTFVFTPENSLQFVYGSTVVEGEIEYYTDEAGNKCARTNGFNFIGEWTYTIKDDTLTIVKPAEDDGEDEVLAVLNKDADFTYNTMEADKDFAPDEDLVGKWMTQYETYEFTEDGYVNYIYPFDDGNQVYTIQAKYTYTVESGLVTLKYMDFDGAETEDSYEYSVEGDVLDFEGVDFYRDGKGMPEEQE